MNVRHLSALVASIAVLTAEAQTISIKGSNTFGEKLAPALIDAFTAMHPELSITLESMGSGTGIAALLDENCEIAASSRSLNEDEIRLARSRNIHIETYSVGYYGIALIVNPDNPVRALADDEIEGIFTGDIMNWDRVGGSDAPIHLYIRNASSGTYLGFRELAMQNRAYSSKASEKGSYHEIRDAVRADPNGIGFVSLDILKDNGVKGIIVNGIHPTTYAVVGGLYPYARLVRLMVDTGKVSNPARAFISFAQSRAGQAIIEKEGFVPQYSPGLEGFGLGY